MIRYAEATKEDILGIIQVMKNTGYIDFAYKGMKDKEIEKDISKSKDTYLVCYESQPKKIIGYFIFSNVKNHLKEAREHTSINNQYAYHLGIGIHSSFREKKIGKKLTKYALKKAKEKFNGMYADVASNNIPSIKLQESTGFKKIAEYNSKKRIKGIKNILYVKHF